MHPFPSQILIQQQQKNPRYATPLNQIHPVNQRLRLQEVNHDAPSQVTAQKDAEARALRG